MPQCYHHKGRGAFDPVTTPRTKWAPSPDHYPILKSAGGHLVPENVRLSHVWCNNRDYGWRTRIRTMLAKGKSLADIAEALNSKGVPRPTAGTVGRPPWCARPTCRSPSRETEVPLRRDKQRTVRQHGLLSAVSSQTEQRRWLSTRARSIVDLMLSKATHFADRRQHLVVELKRPSVKLSQTELNQITKYAVAVSLDDRFKTPEVTWDFWLVGDTIDEVVEDLVNQKDAPPGRYMERANYRIWVRRWAELVEDNRQRLHFAATTSNTWHPRRRRSSTRSSASTLHRPPTSPPTLRWSLPRSASPSRCLT
jgi:hypothetical protein